MAGLGPKVLRYLWPYRYRFLIALSQVFLITAFELLKPWPLKVVIDNVISGEPLAWQFAAGWSAETLLLSACLALVLIYLLLGGLHVLNDYITIRIGQMMVNDLRRDLYSHLQRLSLAFHSGRSLGDLLYRVTADTMAIQTLTMNGIFPALLALGLLGGMFVIMAQLDWFLTLLALSVCPVLFFLISFLTERIATAATQARYRESLVYSLVQRTMSAIRVVQAFTKEEEEQRRFLAASEESLAADLRLYTLQSFYMGAVNVGIALGTALVVWIGARHVLSGILSVGEMVVFMSYLASLYAPVNNIFQTYSLTQRARAGVQRVFEILAIERDIQEGTRLFPAAGASGEVVFKGVSFYYRAGHPVLKQIDLRVRPGEKLAIVGPTGVGKSTLVSLVPRFYDPQAGRVTVDGVDLREFQLMSLRRQIAMVLQPPLVFPITIRENIVYGRPEATEEEIISAARMASIHDFIAQLPQGYDTVVGEQGVTLSEGEKQRLTIARAILRNAPILILDEPTSSVDAETEALIIEGLQRLMAGRTTFIIAHRLSTVRQADLIVVLREGEIVERGTFAELMRRRGPFASLYRTQFGLYEEGRNFRLIK
jgi:ATP-binding cassette subfamily B protein/subfamily B ATP-binding cassette protein MsbA